MRGKIIGVYTIVVLLVGGLAFGLMRASLGDLSNREETSRAVTAAVTQLELEALRIERWLGSQAATRAALQRPFDAGTPDARRKTATEAADEVNEAAKRDAVFGTVVPALVVVLDARGVVLGRNGSALMRGQPLGERYPAMLKTIRAGETGSDVWLSPAHNEQLLASYAPVRDADGSVVGAVAIGTSLSDERLGSTAGLTSGAMLFAACPVGDAIELVAKSRNADANLLGALRSPAATEALRQALSSAGVVHLAGIPEGFWGSARRLAGYGDDRQAVVMAVAPVRTAGATSTLLWPVLGTLLLGFILTVGGAYLLDSYISRPISDLEEGLLAIINGQREIRFEIEHALLGGLVFRLNSLLNELLGVAEDNTDEQGRVSVAPAPQPFTEALTIDERLVSVPAGELDDAGPLREEDADTYYRRVFDAYRDARRELGDPVDHVGLTTFTRRVRASEQDLTDRHQKPFRFRVEVQEKDVVLVAVPLA